MSDKRYKLLKIISYPTGCNTKTIVELTEKIIGNTLTPSYKYYAENKVVFEKLKSEGKEDEYPQYFHYDKYPARGCEDFAHEVMSSSLNHLMAGFEVDSILCTDFGGVVDLKEAIEIYQPDLIMYVPVGETQTPEKHHQIIPVNADAYPEIPRVSSVNYDKVSPLSSAGFMIGEELGVDASFSNAIVDGEFDWLPFPSFYYPQSVIVSGERFKDYKEKKEFTIGMFGSGFYKDGFYPWRGAVVDKICGKYPAVHFPQPFNSGRMHLQFPRVIGEDYARMINRCQFGIACGSVTKTVLAKHFEIPASRACLLTEDTVFLREHGFVDGENCVCVTPENVEEKINYYLSNLDKLERITENGYNFVHDNWVMEKMPNNLYTWFTLRKNLQARQKIIQTGVFDFEIIAESDINTKRLMRGEDCIVDSWKSGFKHLQQGEIEQAHGYFQQTLQYVGYEPLGRLGMALVNLFSKRAQVGMQYLDATFAHEQTQGGMGDYHDPVDLAYYIIACICMGDRSRAYGISKMWSKHTHLALEAARKLAAAAVGQAESTANINGALKVHSRCPVVISTLDGWIAHFQDVFKIYSITI